MSASARAGIPSGEALELARLISYQEVSVVSRSLVQRESCTITLFAFDAGQELVEHTTPFDALVYILDGEAEITIAGRALRARAGELVLMPANQPHALKAAARFRMLLTMVRG